MLRRGHEIAPHIGGLDEVTHSQRISEAERLAQLPHLKSGGRMHDLRTGVGCRAVVENACSRARQRIGFCAVGKREARTRVNSINLFGSGGAARLPEADVKRHQPSADVRKSAIENDLTALIAIE